MTIADSFESELEADGAPEEWIGSIPGDRHGFQIKDSEQANWALRMVSDIDREYAEVESLAEGRIKTVTEWRTEQGHRLGDRRRYFEGILGEYHRHLLEEDPKAKTVKLIDGTLVARKLPDTIEIADEDEFLLAADEAYVRTVRSIDRAAVKEAVLKGGEILAGVRAIEGDVRFSVKTETNGA